VRLLDDTFQCHAYLVDNGTDSVLIDPGSNVTIDGVLSKVRQVMPLDHIKYLVCHHADPDVCSSLTDLTGILKRDDVQVVTEWRARELLDHYGHRFPYYLLEDHAWRLPLAGDRELQFQLTPYLHFPGAFVSFDTLTGTLFSADLFGGFVPDSNILVGTDLEYILEAARPFHQHYMPSRQLLEVGLTRIQQHWPDIARIAPQHGHIIEGDLVQPAFEGLKQIECGIFTLSDADLDLQHLMRLSECRAYILQALLEAHSPGELVAQINRILLDTQIAAEVLLRLFLPDERQWVEWGREGARTAHSGTHRGWMTIPLDGAPKANLLVGGRDGGARDQDFASMLDAMASIIRPTVEQYLAERRLHQEAETDQLTGLGNRRALELVIPADRYCVMAMDVDHFKRVNDEFGHPAGDRVLRRVSAAVRNTARSGDGVFRTGGEEFLVYLPRATKQAAIRAAERIRAAVSSLDLTGEAPDGHVTLSVGIAELERSDANGLDDVMSHADEALYRAKSAGRNQISVYSAAATN
ncbi:MAG: diguanylate cyclase, partial [Actinomycetota bacterium]|nr:diguanylate cyclase [Actinomycetota bacterium]